MDIDWSETFEIGHERIDFEHRIFLGLITDLNASIERGDTRERLLRIVREIEAYARFHFLSEENIMIDIGYPDYDEHHSEHTRLLAGLEDQIFFTQDAFVPSTLVDFLFEWFALHTTQVDKKIADFIRQGGV